MNSRGVTHLFYRRDGSTPPTSAFALPDGYVAQWWSPFSRRPFSAALGPSWKYLVWRAIYRRHALRAHFGGVTVSAPGGELVHCSIVFPKYFRFPFMGETDLQVGNLWTAQTERGRGIATYAVQEAIRRTHHQHLNLWYVAPDDNQPSIRVATKNGFLNYGIGRRRKRCGTWLLGTFVVLSDSDQLEPMRMIVRAHDAPRGR
jgi:RimJ/RimL family protein N-acetyltransferase